MTTGNAAINPSAELFQRMDRIAVSAPGAGFHDITAQLAHWLSDAGAGDGLLTLFLRHTSAGLTIQENADPTVLTDLSTALGRLAPEDGGWIHDYEGPDDMPAHIKSLLSGVNLQIPVRGGAMELGTWQGVYLAEFRTRPHRRTLSLHYFGTMDG